MPESAEVRRNKKHQQRKMDEDSKPNFIRLYRYDKIETIQI